MKNVSVLVVCVSVCVKVLTDYLFSLVEFATIQLVDEKVKYDQYKPEEIDALLKEQNVGAATTTTEPTTTQ